ncbi:MAG: hypothetical protein IJL78_04770 [Lachnospiraceae bacterium]|nr:hypothetical protein [Lachnospiraceae bacterium]
MARAFMEADGLTYPGNVPSCMKRYPMYNRRLIELQKEYARELLTHVNPYTGLALKDDPAVMTVQINNEESAIKGNNGADRGEEMKPYRDEVGRRFGEFLLSKYETREALREAWTFDGVSALSDDEDPAAGTVRGIEGGFYQSVGEPMGPWDAPEGPARYEDFMEFGAEVNRGFYREMKAYLRDLGVRAPIVASNLMAGAADVYGHTDGDLMENNCYFNHPILPVQNDTYMVYGPVEYVSTNPLTVQRGIGAMGTTLLSLASVAAVHGKPVVVSEWNEYGLHPFHSTAFVQMAAYACLNDWDGLILYNYHTAEHPDDEPADEIRNVFDAYNDPALICQWGFIASMFLKGLVSPAKTYAEVVYTANDWKTLPNFNAMPMCFLPYVTAFRNVFLESGGVYVGDANVALNAGFLNGGDLRHAKHGVYYAWSPYRDAKRRVMETERLAKAAEGGRELQKGAFLSDQALVLTNIAETAHYGDYHEFAAILDASMKAWGVMPEDCGLVNGALVSDTGEITFDPDHSRFRVRTESLSYFSGAPEKETVLSERIAVKAANERISLALLPLREDRLDSAKEFLLTAVGTTGTDAESMSPGPELMPGLQFTMVRKDGKLFAETLEGSLEVKAHAARLTVLDPSGTPLGEVRGEQRGDSVYFNMLGDLPGVQYHLMIGE